MLVSVKFFKSFSVIIKGNPTRLLQYDVIINTSILHKCNAKISSISVSVINILIVILYHNL